jgi:hypothetical protein
MGHGGGIDGFSTDIARYPDDHICIIVLSNFEHASRILPQGLAAIVFGEEYELPHVEITVNPEIFDEYIGRYGSERDDVHTFTKENNKLFLQPPRGTKERLFPESETTFFSRIVDAQFSFIKDKKGKVIKVILHQHGEDFDLEKVG